MDSKTPEPVLISQSILVGLHAFFGGSAATMVIVEANPVFAAVFAFGNLAVAAAQLGIAFYTRGQVVPIESVSERVVGGLVVAGPANEMVPDGAVVRELGDRLSHNSHGNEESL